MSAKLRMTKKQRKIAHGLASGDSEVRKAALRSNGMLQPSIVRAAMVKEVENNPMKLFNRLDQANAVIKVWQRMIDGSKTLDDQTMRWSDILKASELMAKYAGMFGDEKVGDTYNTVVINAKDSDEGALLERLQAIQGERAALGTIVDESPPIDTTPQ